MKRYTPEQQYIPADMTETEDGDYVLYDDVAALLSTALVPVMVDSMLLSEMEHPIRFFKHPCDGRICERLQISPSQLDYLVCIFGQNQQEWWPRNRRVTPVRLVPALDVMEGE